MNPARRSRLALALLGALLLGACESNPSEHAPAGKEAGTELGLEETYDATRNGVRLVLSFDSGTHSFSGTVINVGDRTRRRVRVEVRLSNGKKLGPTAPVDLDPGQRREFTLVPETTDFDSWSAHPEVGSDEPGR